MNVSPNAYEKAKEMLAYIKLNPFSHMQQISEGVGMLKVTAHLIVQKMVDAGVLTFTSRKYRGGKQFLYQVTGKPLPARTSIHKVKPGQVQQKVNEEPISEKEFVSLPSYVRAITPVTPTAPVKATGFYGHTKEQHQRQSAIIRKERSAAQRGAIYTGVSRL